MDSGSLGAALHESGYQDTCDPLCGSMMAPDISSGAAAPAAPYDPSRFAGPHPATALDGLGESSFIDLGGGARSKHPLRPGAMRRAGGGGATTTARRAAPAGLGRAARRHALGLLALALCAPTAARADVFQPGTQPVGEDDGIVEGIQPALGCAECHSGYDRSDDFEPFDSWRGTLMASAGRDPVFRAALAVAEADHPDAADFCIRCHSPPAWLRGRSSLPEWSADEGPRLAPDSAGGLSTDLDGVTCMVCHRSIDDVPTDPDAPYLRNAQLFYADGMEADTMRGPYDYEVGTGPMHRTAVSDFLPRSDMCGQCHDIVNPLVMGRTLDGTPTGRPMAVERTYSEWLFSAFSSSSGQTCQDCHMPDVDEDVPAARGGRPRAYMRRHTLVGANSWVPRALAGLTDAATERVRDGWERTATRAEENLRAAARLEITDTTIGADTIRTTVRVTNLTGHKLPTGYPDGRRMWLEVALLDAAGEVVTGSGLYDDETYALLEDPQRRTYEVHLGDGDTPSFHFALSDTILLDTRIPPAGFDPPGDRDMIPVGRDYTDASGAYRDYDEPTFELPACGTSLRVRLRYQSTTREYIEFLRDEAPDSADPDIDNWGRIAYDAWLDHGGHVPVDMAEVVLALDGLPACETGGGGCACNAAPAGGRRPFAILAALLLVAFVRRRRGR